MLVSRVLDPATGGERLRAAVGQRFYFSSQRVTLPGGGSTPVSAPGPGNWAAAAVPGS